MLFKKCFEYGKIKGNFCARKSKEIALSLVASTSLNLSRNPLKEKVLLYSKLYVEVYALIRRRFLQRMIRVNTAFLCPIYRRLGIIVNNSLSELLNHL